MHQMFCWNIIKNLKIKRTQREEAEGEGRRGVLVLEPAIPVYRKLLDIPFVAFTKFNNTVVMGSLVAGLVLYIPVYIISRLLVKLWRVVLAPKITASKLWVGIKKLPLIEKIISKSQEISGVIKQ